MELTYEKIEKWFDGYYEACNMNMGPLETVPNLVKYFAPDLEFWMYTAPAFVETPMSREQLLVLMVHPGLRENLIPQYYTIDLKKMIVVVQFEIRFVDEHTGKAWPPKQASCHYHLMHDDAGDIKIRKYSIGLNREIPRFLLPCINYGVNIEKER